ncbi:MAG: EAL domain-containing protein [Clostridiales bacterium]|nr:EAL domain-containing protein [Clostridiales bacterium]
MKNENITKKVTFAEIALPLARDYNSIYVIDSHDDSYVEYLPMWENGEMVCHSSGDDFYADTRENARVLVHPEDQEYFLSMFKKERVTEALKDGKSFSINYRLLVNGQHLYYYLKTIKSDDDKVIIGVQDVDEQRKLELEENKELLIYRYVGGALASRYEAIYYVNIHTDSFTCFSKSDMFTELGTTFEGDNFFERVIPDARKVIHKDDLEEFLSIIDKKNILDLLDKKRMISHTYRQILGGGIKYLRMNVVRPAGDENHIVVGVINIDAQIKREQQLQEESKLFDEVAMALASRYEVIYRVNTVTNAYREYSASEKYTKLKVGNKGEDFFSDTQRNMKRDIYVEDYPMMAQAMNKDNILQRLKEVNKMTLNYRLNLDGRPQYVSLVIMRATADSDHIIVAVENVDEAKKKEIEYEAMIMSAIDMANKDALTSVKNKHAYVNAEMQLDKQINSEKHVEFAIVVCDINGLKKVNDEQGHSSGDIYIKDACAMICEVFDHSPVYRIGGDEFVVILMGSDYTNRFNLIKRLSAKQIENRQAGLVNLSCGLSEYLPDRDLRVQDVFERADKLMYVNKKRLKEMLDYDNEPSVESYSFVRFYELYEKLLSAMNNFDKVDVPLIESLLIKLALMFRLSKGITKVYKTPQEEKEGKGETLCCFDLGEECNEFLTLRVVTSVMTSVQMTVYMAPDQEPLSNEELQKLDLVMRTTVSFISRNRLKDVVYELAYYDDAGYPNLKSLNAYMAKMVRSNAFRNKMAFRYNLRHFSLINQEFGREAGDKIIRAHYDLLKSIMGEESMLVRLGGDNFVGICNMDKSDEISKTLSEAVIRLDDSISVKVPSSAGILLDYEGFAPSNPGDIMGAIINAYRVAQNGGKDRVIFFDEEIMKRKMKLASVQQKFSDALANEEFKPFYQPKVDVNTGKIVGGEALCRWFHDGEMIPPAFFIPALEQTSDICKLDLYMLEHVCRDQRAWLDGGEGRVLVPMSVNFSRKHMMNMELPDTIEKILDKYRIPHDCIEIELTETTTDVEFSDLRRIVNGLNERGISTSVDDFGMGYSSLNLLKGIPWNTLKIDKSFLPEEGDPADGEKSIMFRAVVTMAKALGLNCIAEGVETAYQVDLMREHGCDIAQGYYYDKPLPKEEFEARLITKRYDV